MDNDKLVKDILTHLWAQGNPLGKTLKGSTLAVLEALTATGFTIVPTASLHETLKYLGKCDHTGHRDSCRTHWLKTGCDVDVLWKALKSK